ncbi:hypothetical protein EDD15DRAFT_2263970 [Pisolithus albus]|nr:hypothetical protein EDD15DRAFT_2263970 [Pisolithus albus]
MANYHLFGSIAAAICQVRTAGYFLIQSWIVVTRWCKSSVSSFQHRAKQRLVESRNQLPRQPSRSQGPRGVHVPKDIGNIDLMTIGPCVRHVFPFLSSCCRPPCCSVGMPAPETGLTTHSEREGGEWENNWRRVGCVRAQWVVRRVVIERRTCSEMV